MGFLVHELTGADRDRIERHLAALDDHDRRLRFGASLGAEALHDYVQGLDFERDALFGAYGERFELAAVAHLGCVGTAAELGLSVLPNQRRRGLALGLLERVVRRARTLGFATLWVHCLYENHAMMQLARKAGMEVVIAAGEADAYLKLPPATPLSYGLDLYESQVALLLWAWRNHAA